MRGDLQDLTPSVPPTRSGWRAALGAAGIVAVIAIAGAIAVAASADDPAPVAAAPTTAATDTPPTETTIDPPPRFTDRPANKPDGTVDVAPFNAYLAEFPTVASRSPSDLARLYTGAHPRTIEPLNVGTASHEQSVLVVRREEDDSIAETRWKLVFTPQADGEWRLTSGQWSQRCRPGRGHQDFSTEWCI
jgi:hypothetical protein